MSEKFSEKDEVEKVKVSDFNYENFKKDPSDYLINLDKKKLEKEYTILKEGKATEDNLIRIEELRRQLALFNEFGEEAKVEMEKNAPKESLSEDKIVNIFKSFTNKLFLNNKFKFLKPKFAEMIKPIKYYALALMFSVAPLISQGHDKGDMKDFDKNKYGRRYYF